MNPELPVSVFWFRRDLRLEDNNGLSKALSSGFPIIPLFIFDESILDSLPVDDARVTFIHQQLSAINKQFARLNSSMVVYHGTVSSAFELVCSKVNLKEVYCNHDYEPYATERDSKVKSFLESKGTTFHSYKDQVIFERNEILKPDGTPYTVFTPYMRRWKANLADHLEILYPIEPFHSNFLQASPQPIPTLEDIGFRESENWSPLAQLPNPELLTNYQEKRDFPAKKGTSRLSVHFRFGTISIRQAVKLALDHSETWLNELIWREFYMMILWHFPYVVNRCFKSAYNLLPWRNNEEDFERWCNGTTGYPLVDAGMRELNATGYMHNRLRMITASFLTKHLLISWQWGEAYFAEKLIDYELSSNNGGWQWSAGCGCDAAPYFRIFNPTTQMAKFDPHYIYTEKWVPEYKDSQYPEPMVDHKLARNRAINTFKQTLDKQ